MTITDLLARERAKIAADRHGHLAQYTACHDRELLLDIVEAAAGGWGPDIDAALDAWQRHHEGERA
jgi:hypothetical protein